MRGLNSKDKARTKITAWSETKLKKRRVSFDLKPKKGTSTSASAPEDSVARSQLFIATEHSEPRDKSQVDFRSKNHSGITYSNDGASVRLISGQSVIVEGACYVELTNGSASIDGYFLQRNQQLLIKSNQHLFPSVSITNEVFENSNYDICGDSERENISQYFKNDPVNISNDFRNDSSGLVTLNFTSINEYAGEKYNRDFRLSFELRLLEVDNTNVSKSKSSSPFIYNDVSRTHDCFKSFSGKDKEEEDEDLSKLMDSTNEINGDTADKINYKNGDIKYDYDKATNENLKFTHHDIAEVDEADDVISGGNSDGIEKDGKNDVDDNIGYTKDPNVLSVRDSKIEECNQRNSFNNTYVNNFANIDDNILKIPKEWNVIAKRISSYENRRCVPNSEKIKADNTASPIIVICGAKNVGKSTFAKYVTNSLLNKYEKVCYLETDVGQHEFFIPGVVSLHILQKPVYGNSCFHINYPLRYHFFGNTSPKNDPERYLKMIFSLYDYFRQTFYDTNKEAEKNVDRSDTDYLEEKYFDDITEQNDVQDRPYKKLTSIPLVINTLGWVKGIGLDVLTDLIRYVFPTHVIQINSSSGKKNLPHGKFWINDNQKTYDEQILSNIGISYLVSVVRESNGQTENESGQSQLTAVELRSFQILSFFESIFNLKNSLICCIESAKKNTFFPLSLHLITAIPYQINIKGIKVLHLPYDLSVTDTLLAINGSLVGLASSREKGTLLSSGDEFEPPCKAIGFIRSVDVAKGLIFLLTHLKLNELKAIDIILTGQIEFPLTSLLECGIFTSPYLYPNSQITRGSITIRNRNNLRRHSHPN